MKALEAIIKIVITLIVCSFGWGSSSLAQSFTEKDLENPKIIGAFVDGLVVPLMAEEHSPSGVVTIVKDGKIVFSKGYGYQDIEQQIPVNPETTLVRPGSITKLFTWVAVMQLVEAGQLDLDTDINTYLKKVEIKDTFPGNPITMRHIMTHTTGFEDGGIGRIIVDSPEAALPLEEAMIRYQPERIILPGKQASYSNYASALAGVVISDVTGLAYAEYVQKNILDVLGMDQSTFDEPLSETAEVRLAKAYVFSGEQYIERPFEIITSYAPAGSLSAPAVDMVKFSQALLNGGEYEGRRILKEETVTQFFARNFSHDDRITGMSLGTYDMRFNGSQVYGHGGDTKFFHSKLIMDPHHNLSLFVSFVGKGGVTIRGAFIPAFYKTFFPTKKKRLLPPEDFGERADKYTGEYRFWRMNFSTVEKAFKISAGTNIEASGRGTLIIPEVGEYVEIDRNLFQRIDDTYKLAFQEGENGEITGFVFEGAPFLSTFKAPFYYTTSFSYTWLAFSYLAFVIVLLKRFYQRARYRVMKGPEKNAARASVLVSSLNILAVLLVPLVIGGVAQAGVTTAFKLWLFLPLTAVVAAIYHLYCTYKVWALGLLGSIWQRIGYALVTVAALFMCWFYYFWNFLGFQYV